MAAQRGMTLAFTGNIYMEHSLSVCKDEGFLRAIELMRSVDASFANLECSIRDGDEWPAFGSGMGWAGSYLGAPPSMVDDIKFLGITALYAANNHAADFGEQGILATIKHLRRAGIPFSGIGASLEEASAPCYVATPRGRVAMICAADWGPRERMDLPFPWPAGYLPSDDGPWFPSRPGVNLLRYDATIHVDKEALDQLRRISPALDWERPKISRREGGGQHTQTLVGSSPLGWERDTETEFFFMGRKFAESDEFKVSTFAYREDLDRLLKSVHDARRQADVVVVGLHDQSHGQDVHDYVKACAYGSIDAGADIFMCTGGIPRGIEFYKGKAILHGTPGFCFQNTQVSHVPPSVLRRMGLPGDSSGADFVARRADDHVRSERAGGLGAHMPAGSGSMVQVVAFDEHRDVKEVRIYPIERTKGTQYAVPLLLDPGSELFERVLRETEERCEAFGTRLERRDGCGVIAAR